jgi:glutamyl-tRNA reductase
LFDIDSLNAQLEDSLAHRLNEVPRVKEILKEELIEFEGYLKSLDMLPIIADIRQQAEAIRLMELEKSLRRMPDLTDAERERIEALTQALVKKILDHPTRRLRTEATSPRAPEVAAMARLLFNLSDEQLFPASPAAD